MPTGYTADVQDGKVTSFNEFAMQCARAFGACITMRDDPSDAAIPEKFEPSAYVVERLKEARDDLARIQSMTINQRALACVAYNVDMLVNWERRDAETRLHRERYEAMLAKSMAWTPPTEDHVKFQDFMIEQLTRSIEIDCRPRPKPETMKRDDWYAMALAEATRSLKYAAESHETEVSLARNRTAWVSALRASLQIAAAAEGVTP